MLLDLSSMATDDGTAFRQWNETRHAVTGLMNRFGCLDSLEFGVDLFPNSDGCDVDSPVLLDTAPLNGENIYNSLSFVTPGQATPLYAAMVSFLDPSYAPLFLSSDSLHYLIVVSSGPDSCGTNPSRAPGGAADAAALSTLAAALREDRDVHTMAIGVGDGEERDGDNIKTERSVEIGIGSGF